jgi:3-oxoacyl-[acyl-carrier-protein] synthase II
MTATTYLKFMSHDGSKFGVHFGVRGRVICTSAACVSATQAIGHGFETIGSGLAEVMLCGGAEELHFSHAAVFDMLHAASKAFNTTPEATPRPFDQRRDGLVVGEGAGTLVLEDYERARRLGKRIYAEILGFGTNCDGTHVTNPSSVGMRGAMELALKSAGCAPTRSTTSTPTPPPPRSATSPRAWPPTSCSAARSRSARSRATSGTPSAPAVRSRRGSRSR